MNSNNTYGSKQGHNQPIIKGIYNLAIKYVAPSNLTYMWSFGVFALISLVTQFLTGILLVMFYAANTEIAFGIVEHIMRDICDGSALRYIHANGASMFFIVVYIHITRGLVYGSYVAPRVVLWMSGVVLLLLMILTAFLGYILPWGQMSLWGATVITNLASTIPVIGTHIVEWLWGGFSVGNPTLNKFFSLHYLFPFIILALVAVHLVLLHMYGSNNPVGVKNSQDKLNFSPSYTIKDVLSLIPFFIVFGFIAYEIPNILGHPDNYIKADGNVTPAHIVPEWYFLLFYAILRAIPNKALGVIALLAAIVVLLVLPFLHVTKFRVSQYKKTYFVLLFGFLAVAIILGFLGGEAIETPYVISSQIATAYYFIFLIVSGLLEKFAQLVKSAYHGIISR